MVEVLIPSDDEKEDFELKPIYITLIRQRPFHGFPHEQPMETLVLFIFDEVPEGYHFYKLFPYSLAGEAAFWFKKLPPGSLKGWNDIANALHKKLLYDAAVNLEIEMESMMRYLVEDDEHHGFGEPSRVEEGNISDTVSASIIITTS